MAKHIRLDDLVVWRQPENFQWYWIFNGNSLNISIQKFKEKFRSFNPFFVPFNLDFPINPQPVPTSFAQIGAWRMRNQQIPSSNIMHLSVHCGHLPPLYGL